MSSIIHLCAALILVAASSLAQAAELKVLFITGDDRAHSWKQQTEETKAILAEVPGRFIATVHEDYTIFDRPKDMAEYDAILMTGSFWDSPGNAKQKVYTITDEQIGNLVAYVKGGKGFYAQHLASASWRENAAFSELCGRRWSKGSGHPARKPFEAKIADPTHLITSGLANFTIDDECYSNFGKFREVDLLVTGLSASTRKDEPLLMASSYGSGRVVINNFGHDRKALQTPELRVLIRRAVEWTASGKVTP